MSEALARLASRALGLSGTVRPRAASRFSDGGMDQPLPDSADAPLVEPGLAAPEAAMPSRLVGTAPPPEARAAVDANPSTQTKPESEPLAGQSMPLPIADVADGRSARPQPGLPATPELLVAAPAGESAASPVPARQAPDRLDPAPFSPASAVADAAPYQPLLPPRADNPPPPAPAIRAAQPPAPAPPDIQISIGRIEVRADKPEPRRPPAAPPRARPALMSLDDYLSRGRGRP